MPLSFQEFESDLKSRFDLVLLRDLVEVTESHSSIFRLLRALGKSDFLDRERLVFYTSHRPSALLLDHVQRAIARCFISNFFVLICCPDDITEDLIAANKKYGYDETIITWDQIAIEDTPKISDHRIHSKESSCIWPMINMEIDNRDRTVLPCCLYQDGSMGDIGKENLIDIFNGDRYQNLRESLRQGQRPDGCRMCWNREKSGSHSLRTTSWIKWEDIADIELFDTPKVQSIKITPGNLCNFKCRICNPRLSTQWAAEEMKFGPEESRSEFRDLIRDGYWNGLEGNLTLLRPIYKDLTQIRILGGEPFLLKELDLVLEDIIQSGYSNNIQLEFNTNGSIWRPEVIKLFPKFKTVNILISIDAVGERFEVERGGVWRDIRENLSRFMDLRNEQVSVKIGTTINIQNVLYLDDLRDLAQEFDAEIIWWYLETPAYLNIDNMTRRARQAVKEKYQNHEYAEFRTLASRMDMISGSDGQKFLDRMKILDSRRGVDFASTHPEIFSAMQDLHI